MVNEKIKELRALQPIELEKKLDELRTELSQLRVAQVTGGAAPKIMRIRVVRKAIAQLLTVYNQARKQKMREKYKGIKKKPLDLRPKLVRSKRLQLTQVQKNKKTKKQIRNEKLFPQQLYALKA